MFEFIRLFGILGIVLIYAINSESKLLQVHVLFRHGDRTPIALTLYPNDPYLNDSWYPDGLGSLTLKGKEQEYNIGKILRSTYDDFLGKIYTPDIMDAWSTESKRAQTSLLATLAGLWPPELSQIWNPSLHWQPIPYSYLPAQQDTLLRYPGSFCPKYKEEYMKMRENNDMKIFLESNKNLMDYCSEHTGWDCKNTMDLFKLYFGLYTEKETGRKLPKWTEKIFPEFLIEGVLLEYELQTYNNKLKKVASGTLLKKIINDAKAKINGTLLPKDRKIYLYSAHEYNIAHLLLSLNVFKQEIPPYGAFITVELHEIAGIYGIKIIYEDYSDKNSKYIVLPECEEFCPFNQFVELLEDILPEDNEAIC